MAVPEEVAGLEMTLECFTRQPATEEGYEPVVLISSRGDIETRYYAPQRPSASSANQQATIVSGVIFVGGAGGGLDTPVRGWLYPRLCQALQKEGVACLRVRYRHPGSLPESIIDLLAGLVFLDEQDVGPVGLVGHSFGGAVVIQAAALSPAVVTCVALSSQSYGAGPAARLAPRCSLLLAHGNADEVLTPECSHHIFKIAREPKRLLLKDGVHHGLDEWSDELPGILQEWLGTELSRAVEAMKVAEQAASPVHGTDLGASAEKLGASAPTYGGPIPLTPPAQPGEAQPPVGKHTGPPSSPRGKDSPTTKRNGG